MITGRGADECGSRPGPVQRTIIYICLACGARSTIGEGACALSTAESQTPGPGGVSLEIAGHDYTGDKLGIKMAFSHMESLLGVYGGYSIGPPSERFGWTFFVLSVSPKLQAAIESKFADMLAGYSKEGDRDRRLAMFISDYLDSRNCNLKVQVAS